MACATSGADCVVRDSCPPRGPKKGYLKTLQKKIGKGCSQSFYFPPLALGLMKSRAVEEDLQTQLDNQQEASTTETRAFSPSQEGVNTNNEDESSIDNNEVQDTPTTTPITTGNIQHWPAPGGFQFPMIHLEPWEGIENSYSSSSFPALDYYQEPAQVTMGAELHITPMMHNDL